ncbi:thioesterase II family protein [Kitasatospora sp. DSM 101779]|uniref:thioesterase II family protein n=1 Tax=Kitasatospora sp. DSM 101779 TaxID=2853165 RepID=UPI0021DAB5A9|nr:thioesterase domain-containing protein [Kitasatospora sp. DSM 101779]MCU7821182.1 thioesterase [Kitasatospora sp. DSM 101779]
MAGNWLLRRPRTDPVGRLFCFPYSGVGASMFSRWPEEIDGIEVCPVQPPGRENRSREAHYGSYERFAADLVEFLRPYLDRPFAFFGHCAGALPAFETALRLAETGLPAPARLYVSAQVAPHDCPHDRYLDLDEEQLRGEMSNLVTLRGGTPHPVLIDLALEVLHEDLEVNRVYRRPAPVALPGPVTVLEWTEDTEISLDQMAGWRHYAEAVEYTALPGGHFDFLSAPPLLMKTLSFL